MDKIARAIHGAIREHFQFRSPSDMRVAAVSAFVFTLIGAADLLTAVDYQIFPLYFFPVSWLAWHRGRGGAFAAAALSTVLWFGSHFMTGLRYPRISIWVVNIIAQAASLLFVGLVIAALRTALEKERALSRTDPLTRLLNLRAFYEEGERILAITRRHGQAVTVAYIDLDGFKRVNDAVGHHEGDKLLRRVADLLSQAIRTGDIIARIGGDEFVVLLPQTGPEGAKVVLERLRSTIVEALRVESSPITLTVGAVSAIEPPVELDSLIRQADRLMYTAKAAGRNRLHLEVFGPRGANGT